MIDVPATDGIKINSTTESSATPVQIESVMTPPEQAVPGKTQFEIGAFEAMLRSIQEMVSENSMEIMELKRELATKRTHKEDTSQIEAILAEQEQKSQELLTRLGETEGRLAESEAQNRSLSNTVKTQGALLEQRKALEFTEAEAEEIRKYTAIIIFDTCSIMNFPNLLSGVRDGELVVVPKDVNNELEHHKTAHYYDDRKIKAQKAITAIFNYKRKYPLIYADAMIELVPEVYRADEGERELNDNKILAVAIRYRRFTDIPVVFITDDRSLSNKAAGEDIEVWTAKDFLTPPSFPSVEPKVVAEPAVQATEPSSNVTETNMTPEEENTVVAVIEDPEAMAVAEQRRKEAQAEFLAQKISTKNLQLDARQISTLQNNGIKTLADFMTQTEETFSKIKVKKGIPYVAKYLKEQEHIKEKLERM